MKGLQFVLSRLSKPRWFAKKSYLFLSSVLMLKPTDVIFVCFTRTGSSWTRIVLYNLLSGKKSTDNFTFDEVDSTMSAFGNPFFLKKWPFLQSPKITLTRHYYSRIFRKNPIIFLARDPRDIMVSAVPYANGRHHYQFEGGLTEVAKHKFLGIENYLKLYDTWRDHIDLLIRYEDLRKTPLETFRTIVDYIGIECTDAQIQEALDCSSIQNTRKAQKTSSDNFQNQFKKDFVFARKGGYGEGELVFDDELNAYYKGLREQYNFDLYPF